MASTSKKATVGGLDRKGLAALALAEPARKASRKRAAVGPEAILSYVANADNGEKRTEAGIKYWFEQNVPGHLTEDSSVEGAPDGYTPGWLVLELKSKKENWLEGLFQGLSRSSLNFKMLVVVAHRRLLIFPGPKEVGPDWSEQKISQWNAIVREARTLGTSPNKVGKQLAAKYKTKGRIFIEFSTFQWSPEDDEGALITASQTADEAISVFHAMVTSFERSSARVEITPRNFAEILRSLLPFFDEALEKKFEVVHGFFRSMTYWNNKYSPIPADDELQSDRVYLGGAYFEGLRADAREDFCKAIQNYEVIETDKSKFYAHYDLAIDAVDPEYRANNGIYFTNEYLARLAITLSETHLGSISDKYIVFDPACGSGNLVTSWNHHLDLRHKVVSEISPILLKAFELRFQGKSTERKRGFTIIPKTSSGEGLNFVSQDASSYLERINSELKQSGHKLNKPLAIVCNPPYRNQKDIKDDFYKYDIDPSIVKLVGSDGSKELFVCFLAQITEICRVAEENNFPPNSVVLLFTQSGWLTGKSSYSDVRDLFFKKFSYTSGFVVNSSEFFEGTKSWPLVVSLWEFSPNKDLNPAREVKFRNLLNLKRTELKQLIGDDNNDFDDLSNWGTDDVFRRRLEKVLKNSEDIEIVFNRAITKLKDNIPPQAGDGNQQISQDMMAKKYYSGGLCFADEKQLAKRKKIFKTRIQPIVDKNIELKKLGKKLEKIPSFVVLGNPDGKNIGFSEGKQPYRTTRTYKNDGKTLFFLMDTRFHKMNTSQCLSGVPPKRGHVVTELDGRSKMLIIGYAMAHSLAGAVPDQFNQFDMWVPTGTADQLTRLWELSCAFLFANNSCIECEVPKDHPIDGNERIYVTNPLSPLRGTFWTDIISPLVRQSKDPAASIAMKATDDLFKAWKKWAADHSSYRAKAKLPIYLHERNRIPGDGWGIYQIEQEIKLLVKEESLQVAAQKRKAAVKDVKVEIQKLIVEMGYWIQ